jgi:hypothetical protein
VADHVTVVEIVATEGIVEIAVVIVEIVVIADHDAAAIHATATTTS